MRSELDRADVHGMISVSFPSHLRRHFPVPPECLADGETVAEVVHDLDRQFPGLAGYLVHEDGSLRQHVNIFLDERWLADRKRLSDPISGVGRVYVMQALSGG
jgi:molybdopterin converting factor small subunit